jgi:hypothetical protein
MVVAAFINMIGHISSSLDRKLSWEDGQYQVDGRFQGSDGSMEVMVPVDGRFQMVIFHVSMIQPVDDTYRCRCPSHHSS